MPPHESSEPTPGIPLETSVDELRRRCETAARLQGSSTYYHEELGVFRNYAAEKGIFLAGPPPELSRTPDDEGNEHQVWFVTDSSSAFLGDLCALAVKNSSSSIRKETSSFLIPTGATLSSWTTACSLRLIGGSKHFPRRSSTPS